MLARSGPSCGHPARPGGRAHLLWHPDLPYAARPAYGVLVAAAIGSMPGWARRELRLPWAPVTGPARHPAMGRAATSTIRWG